MSKIIAYANQTLNNLKNNVYLERFKNSPKYAQKKHIKKWKTFIPFYVDNLGTVWVIYCAKKVLQTTHLYQKRKTKKVLEYLPIYGVPTNSLFAQKYTIQNWQQGLINYNHIINL